MNKKASVAVIIATILPAVLFATALPVEIGNWERTQLELQRNADASAKAGMLAYQGCAEIPITAVLPDPTWWSEYDDIAAPHPIKCRNHHPDKVARGIDNALAIARVNMPELAVSDVSISYDPGLVVSSNRAITIVITKSVGLIFLQNFRGPSIYTLRATSTAELIGATGSCPVSPHTAAEVDTYAVCKPAIVR